MPISKTLMDAFLNSEGSIHFVLAKGVSRK